MTPERPRDAFLPLESLVLRLQRQAERDEANAPGTPEKLRAQREADEHGALVERSE